MTTGRHLHSVGRWVTGKGLPAATCKGPGSPPELSHCHTAAAAPSWGWARMASPVFLSVLHLKLALMLVLLSTTSSTTNNWD